MTSQEIREKFLNFFKARGHAVVPSSSLVPENDPTVLFTTAGMQQFKPYYTNPAAAGKKFGTVNVASIQKCFRTSDIDEVGDETHLTYFEMLGNFSFGGPARTTDAVQSGGYFKREAIAYAEEFVTKELHLPIQCVSVFESDDESAKLWRELGYGGRTKRLGKEDNFWGPTGEEGPCGPTTEIYVGGVEIWNIVFNQYYCRNGLMENLETPGVDTGMGLERLAVALQGKHHVFETDLFAPLIAQIGSNGREARIVADHVRAAGHLIEDGVRPSNAGRGYVLRRLIRRAVRYGRMAGVSIAPLVSETARSVAGEEEEKFLRTLEKGLKEFERGTDPFTLFTTYGFPIEMTEELARERGGTIDRAAFDQKLAEHQKISRHGAGMFNG